MAKRRRFTEREVVSIVVRQLGLWGNKPHIICPICEQPIHDYDIDDMERDHERALELLGDDHPSCCRYTHGNCHRIKTKDDIRRIAKAKRQAGETGQRARRAKRGPTMQSGRPMPGTKASGLKKKFDGTVEKRT